LLLGNVDEAVAYLEFCNSTIGNILMELVRMRELGLKQEHYRQALYDLYTAPKVDKAFKILSAEEYLVSTALHRDYHNMLDLYDRLDQKKRAKNL
jgi:ribosomal protein S12 methylthiotransferase accessory factor